MRRAIFSVILTAVAMACGSFDEADEPTGTPGPVDASSDASDSGAETDGSDPVDAGAADGRTKGDGGAVKRCTGTSLLDDAFMRAVSNDDGWAPLGTAPGIDPQAGLAPPSLFASAPAVSAGNEVSKRLARPLALPSKAAACIEFDLFVAPTTEMFTDGAFVRVMDLAISSGAHVNVDLNATGFALTSEAENVTFTTFTFGAWHHLAMKAPFGTGPATLELDVAESTSLAAGLGPTPANVAVDIGVYAKGMSGTTPDIAVHIDNFRVTTIP